MLDDLLAPLEAGGEDEVRIEEEPDVEDEAEPLKIAKDHKLPSAEAVEEHRCCHIPYRAWCKWCVMGRGRGDQHRSGPESTIPKVGMDYFFITAGGLKRRDELEYTDEQLDKARSEGEVLKCLIVRCYSTKNIWGHVVPVKGADEDDFAVNCAVEDILWLGHTKLILKGDNEPALQALIARSLDVLRIKTADDDSVTTISKEDPAPYDSQGNGGIEVGVMILRGLFRTLKLCLEARLGKFIPISHASIPWLLQHTCLLMNVTKRGSDGLTAWARARGRAFRQKILGFGETVMFKLPTKGPRSQPDGNMGTKWHQGVFIGYSRESNQYVLGTEDGVAYSRALTRCPNPDRWSGERLANLRVTPWSIRDVKEPEVRLQEKKDGDEAPIETAAAAAPRRFRINASDLATHGFTDGCPQCGYTMRYGKPKAGTQHSQTCRARILKAIGDTPEGKYRLEQYEEKLDRAMVDYSNPGAEAPAESPQTSLPVGGATSA